MSILGLFWNLHQSADESQLIDTMGTYVKKTSDDVRNNKFLIIISVEVWWIFKK